MFSKHFSMQKYPADLLINLLAGYSLKFPDKTVFANTVTSTGNLTGTYCPIG